MDSGQTGRFRELLASERRSADLYEGLAGAATGERREVLNELAAVEREHAAHWAAKLVELGEPVPEQGPVGVRTRGLAWLARRFSVAPCCRTSSAPSAPMPGYIRTTPTPPRRWRSTSARIRGC